MLVLADGTAFGPADLELAGYEIETAPTPEQARQRAAGYRLR